MSNSLRPHGLQPPRFLHLWDFPGKSTGVGCHFLLQIFPTQGLNSGVRHCRQTLYPLSHQGSQYHLKSATKSNTKTQNYCIVYILTIAIMFYLPCIRLLVGFPGSLASKESAGNAGDPGLIPGLGKFPEGIGYPPQYWAPLVAQTVWIYLQCVRPGFDPWVRKIPWKAWQPIPVFLLAWRIPLDRGA